MNLHKKQTENKLIECFARYGKVEVFKDVTVPRPQEDAGVVSGRSVGPAPTKPLGIHREVLGHSQDGEGQTFLQRSSIFLLKPALETSHEVLKK